MTDENGNNESTASESAMADDPAAAVLSELGGDNNGHANITDNPDLAVVLDIPVKNCHGSGINPNYYPKLITAQSRIGY